VADLLTTKQLQELLQIDRTTVYRMLKDGRLTGVKVGQQWRFARASVEAILSRRDPLSASPTALIPLICLHGIQKVFAELAGVATLITGPAGEPVTEISNSCRFCNMILASEIGQQRCHGSWRKLAGQPETRPEFMICHAGLAYAQARIEVNQQRQGLLVAGQYYLESPANSQQHRRLELLAKSCRLDLAALKQAAEEIPVLDAAKRDRMAAWLQSVAATFEHIGAERASLVARLRHISEMSRVDSF